MASPRKRHCASCIGTLSLPSSDEDLRSEIKTTLKISNLVVM